jgi:hypothetical protein
VVGKVNDITKRNTNPRVQRSVIEDTDETRCVSDGAKPDATSPPNTHDTGSECASPEPEQALDSDADQSHGCIDASQQNDFTRNNDFVAFLTRHIKTRAGAFSFDGHRALLGITEALADTDTPRIDVLKATQIGLTTLGGFGYGLWEALRGYNVGYFLPTDAMGREMLGHRLRHAVDDELGSTMAISLRERIAALDTARIYFRGLHSMLGAISVPLDVNLYDEVDDLDREHFLWARQRLDGSHYAREVAFACGRHPGEGIDARFTEGTQHHWHLTCPGCGHADQIPELLFPENVRRVDETWRVVCVRCDRPLDVEADGRWVDHFPSRRDVSLSFRISALSVPWVRLDRLMREWAAAQRDRRLMAPFRCSKLALPDAADRQALSAGDLVAVARADSDALPQPFSGTKRTSDPTFVGIDTGDTCHIAVAQIVNGDRIDYTWFDSTPGEELIERIHHLSRSVDITGILIDQRPEGVLARAVCQAFPSVGYLQRFSESEGERVKIQVNRAFRVLSFDREETLGEWCDLVRRGSKYVTFPGTVQGSAFQESELARHILAGAQRIEAQDTSGLTVYRFRSGAVENHWFMACVFAWRIAEHLYGRRVLAGDIGLVGERTHMGG